MRWKIAKATEPCPLYDVAIVSAYNGEPIINGTVHQAFAPMIAAAPDMLECLRVFVERFDYDEERFDEDQCEAFVNALKLVNELVKEKEEDGE